MIEDFHHWNITYLWNLTNLFFFVVLLCVNLEIDNEVFTFILDFAEDLARGKSFAIGSAGTLQSQNAYELFDGDIGGEEVDGRVAIIAEGCFCLVWFWKQWGEFRIEDIDWSLCPQLPKLHSQEAEAGVVAVNSGLRKCRRKIIFILSKGELGQGRLSIQLEIKSNNLVLIIIDYCCIIRVLIAVVNIGKQGVFSLVCHEEFIFISEDTDKPCFFIEYKLLPRIITALILFAGFRRIYDHCVVNIKDFKANYLE